MALNRNIAGLVMAGLLAGVGSGLSAVSDAVAQGYDRKVDVALLSDMQSIAPGEPFKIGLDQIITPGWHTYWVNPGDSGEATRISWQLPAGFDVSPIEWPMPKAKPIGPFTNYGFSDNVLLPVTISPPAQLDVSEVTIKAEASWLVCEEICIPEDATLTITLPVASDGVATPSIYAADFERAERALPRQAVWDVKADLSETYNLQIAAAGVDASRMENVHFFPYEPGIIDHAAPQTVEWSDAGLTLKTTPGEKTLETGITEPSGLVVFAERVNGELVRNGFTIGSQAILAEAPPSVVVRDVTGDAAGGGASASSFNIGLFQAIAFAILGGIILNIMPCVLPILSLKVMALTKHSGGQARMGGLAYLAGVMLSFAAIGVVLIAIKAAGQSLGWGFQFQSPTFVLAMMALFFLLGLSLSGVFTIGGSVIGAGESLTRRDGHTGSFFTGMLASIAATPCTAPFMGAAVGYALTRSNAEMMLILLALGFGFALPIVLLTFTDAAKRLLPKPGPWMETFKQLLAFPLYATVVWLLWVISIQLGSSGVLAAGIMLIGLGLAAWIIGRPNASFALRSGLAASIVVAVAVAMASFGNLGQSATSQTSEVAAAVRTDGAEPLSADVIERNRRDGKAVFVNVTAAWCISCKVNEQVVLNGAGFQEALESHNVAYVVGDWTNRNVEIAAFLKSFGRAGVPLYLVYPADLSKEPTVLPQILTESMLIEHFERAAAPGPKTLAQGTNG